MLSTRWLTSAVHNWWLWTVWGVSHTVSEILVENDRFIVWQLGQQDKVEKREHFTFGANLPPAGVSFETDTPT